MEQKTNINCQVHMVIKHFLLRHITAVHFYDSCYHKLPQQNTTVGHNNLWAEDGLVNSALCDKHHPFIHYISSHTCTRVCITIGD